MVELVMLSKAKLMEYIDSNEFSQAEVIAISKHRAISHINNPRAKEEDILLILAKDAGQLVGYLGVLADDIIDPNKIPFHVGWMSCLWVDPGHRGKKIAQRLIESAFLQWKDQILLTEFTASAGNLYDKMGIFEQWHVAQGLRYYIKSDWQTILPPKKLVFANNVGILKAIDAASNVVLGAYQALTKSKMADYHIEYLASLDNSCTKWIDSLSSSSAFARSTKEIYWIMQFPWIVESKSRSKEDITYHFTSSEPQFETQCVKISSHENELLAVLLITNRNGHLRIPYVFQIGNEDVIYTCLQKIIMDKKIKTFTIFNKELVSHFKEKPSFGFYKKSVTRPYLRSNKLESSHQILLQSIQDGDGDCAFT